MKRFLALLGLLCTLASPVLAAVGTPTSIGTFGSSSSASTVAVTTTSSVAAGTPIVVLLNGLLSAGSVTDSAGNTYTLGNASGTPASTYVVRMAYTSNSLGLASGGTITATYTGGPTPNRAIAAYAIPATSAIDKSVGNAGTGASPSASTGTLSVADEIVFGLLAQASSTYTEASGFTTLDTVSMGTPVFHTSYQVVAATTSVTFAPTLGASVNYTVQAASLKGLSAGVVQRMSLTGAGQ